MTGYRYLNINLVVSKSFTETSKSGFFDMNTIGVDYNNKEENDFAMQDLLTYELLKNFRLTGVAFYGKPGFKPAMGIKPVCLSGAKYFKR
jgi:hypothetical protein